MNPDEKPNLEGAILRRSQLNGSNFSKIRLKKTFDLQKEIQDRHGNVVNSRNINFHGANLKKCDLSWSDLSGCILDYADLSGADLRGVNLTGSSLKHAVLNKANCESAIFENSNLSFATLLGANLVSTKFISTAFDETNITNSQIGDTLFANISLNNLIGIDSLSHSAPSTVGTDTLVMSSIYLPRVFLQGCGLSDIMIEYIPSMVNPPIQHHSCFISYSSDDERFAKKLYNDLVDRGVRCWFAPEDMKIGDKIRIAIDNAIQLQQKLLLIISESSISSEWVEDEVESAFELERKSENIVLFPIRIDSKIMSCNKGWAAKIKRSRHIGDFSSWEIESNYSKSLKRVLRDLRVPIYTQK